MRRRGHSSASTWYFSQRLGCWIADGRSSLGHRLNGKRITGTAWGYSTALVVPHRKPASGNSRSVTGL